VAQICGHGFANVTRQRQTLCSVSLAANDERAGSPIDVLKPERSHLTRAQPEASEHGQDGEVSVPLPRAAITRRQKALYLLGGQSLWQPSQSPSGD
jgi:hypothetical protein